MWCRCDSTTGYLRDFSVYTGKESSPVSGGGLGSRVVNPSPREWKTKVMSCSLIFFSSMDLLEDLLGSGIQCVTTTRTNREK